jgi:hypothetical protein
MAIAEAQLAARYNRPGHTVIDHRTWVIASDGDLMEGVASEAASLAGHLKLGKLICLYDNNEVTLAAGADITFSEDRAKRFEAYGWQTIDIADGNDLAAIDAALAAARAETGRPSLILVRTHLGFGSPEQDSFKAHGSPLGVADVAKTKANLGWPSEPPFLVPPEAAAHFRTALERGAAAQAEWNARMAAYRAGSSPTSPASSTRACTTSCPPDGTPTCRPFPADAKGMATRVAGGKAMNAIAAKLPALVGGSADLDPSTHTALKGLGDFNPPLAAGAKVEGSDAAAGATRTQRPLRRSRARDGSDRQRPGRARRLHRLRLVVPDLLGLHAAADPARRLDGPARHPRLHPRQHRARRGRSDASAGRAAREPARDPEPDAAPSGRRERDGGGVARSPSRRVASRCCSR